MKCPVCGAAELIHDTRDPSCTDKGETTVISAVTGDFCPACAESILDTADSNRVMREEHHRGKTAPVDVASIVSRVRVACQTQPRRYTQPVDVDTLVVTSVNVPFPRAISAEALAEAIRRDVVPVGYAGHLGRLLGEVPLIDVLRFCDRHQIKAPALARFVRDHRAELALRRPELEEHLDAIVPAP